jgi:CRP/FNR family transcriptional regulator, cyclic AMP receptor protein
VSDPPPTELHLRDHPFFQGIAPEFAERLQRHATERSFAAGEYLFQEGEPAMAFYLLFAGKVALEIAAPDRPRVTIETVGAREVLGWSWLVPPHRWRFDARAVKETRALVVDGRRILETLEDRPEDGYRFLMHLVPVIADRLDMAQIRALDIYGR